MNRYGKQPFYIDLGVLISTEDYNDSEEQKISLLNMKFSNEKIWLDFQHLEVDKNIKDLNEIPSYKSFTFFILMYSSK